MPPFLPAVVDEASDRTKTRRFGQRKSRK